MILNQVTVGCTDYDKSVAFYKAIGLTQIVDAPPRYARFETPTGETFSIHAVERVGEVSTVIYFEIEELDNAVAALQANGIAFETQPTDKSWGWREARLSDPAGNPLCLFYGGDNRRYPAWRIDSLPKEKEMKYDNRTIGTRQHNRQQPAKASRSGLRSIWMAYPVGGAINVGWPHDPRWD